MSSFLKAIPAAAASPYALIAYLVAAILTAFAGYSHWQLREVLRATKDGKASPADLRDLIQVATNTVLPPRITGEQWLANNRHKGRLLIAIALIMAISVVSVIALTKGRTESDLSTARISLQQGTYALDDILSVLANASTRITVDVDSSLGHEIRQTRVAFAMNVNDLPLRDFLAMVCQRVKGLSYILDERSRCIRFRAGNS